MSELDDLVRRVCALESELAEAKKTLEAAKPEEPFKSNFDLPKIDWTAGMKMPPDAAAKLALNVGKGEPQTLEQVQSSWARSTISGGGGFGPRNWDEAERREKERRAEEQARRDVEAKKAEGVDQRNAQTKMFDAMVDYHLPPNRAK
jgi:hypothetical protein